MKFVCGIERRSGCEGRNKNVKVSLIVPVYNAEHVLFETLGNLVHQTFFDQYPGEGRLSS